MTPRRATPARVRPEHILARIFGWLMDTPYPERSTDDAVQNAMLAAARREALR